jgi:hypothetical protein
MNDPSTISDITGYILDKNNTPKCFLDALEITIKTKEVVLEIESNTTLTEFEFTLENVVFDYKNKEYNFNLEGNKLVIDLTKNPTIQIVFNSNPYICSTIGLPINTEDKPLTGIYKLSNCVITEGEVFITTGNGVICKKIKGVFESMKYIDESYLNFVKEIKF